MSLTYDEFKTFLTTFLWKTGDSVVIANLDTLITLANVELERELRVSARNTVTTYQMTSNKQALPDDYKSINSLSIQDRMMAPFTFIPVADMYSLMERSENAWHPHYSLSDADIIVPGPITVTDPANFNLDYRRKIPDFATTDTSWVADDYYDVYVYCVLKHSAMFIREDERLPNWVNMYGAAINSAIENSAFYEERGIPGDKPYIRQSSVYRRR